MLKDGQSNVLLPEEKRNSKKRRKQLINLVFGEIMSVHKYTSWGRTRRPKNITGQEKKVLIKKFSQNTIYGELISSDNFLAA